jgi:mannosyltransferase OCH1-like enzyme
MLKQLHDSLRPKARSRVLKLIADVSRYRGYALPQVPFDAATAIPKLIHQTHRTADLHPEIQAITDDLRARNPSWEYRFYDDRDCARYIEQKAPALLDIFLSIPPNFGAVKSDLFRYIVMYHEGGIYLDCKSTCTVPLEQLAAKAGAFLLSHWCSKERFLPGHDLGGLYPRGEFINWCLAATPGHPYLREVIRQVSGNFNCYSPKVYIPGQNGVLRLSGPTAYTFAIRRCLRPQLHRTYDNHKHDNHKQLGLVYNAAGTDHSELLGSHYDTQTAPMFARAVN